MNGPQHYAEAEKLLETTRRYYNGGQTVRDEAPPAEDVARAQVHATLALAAATIDAAVAPRAEWTDVHDMKWTAPETPPAWVEVLGQ